MPRPRYFANEDGPEDVAVQAHHAGGQCERWRPEPSTPCKPTAAQRAALEAAKRAARESFGEKRVRFAGKRVLA
jgi:hypothetical protein